MVPVNVWQEAGRLLVCATRRWACVTEQSRPREQLSVQRAYEIDVDARRYGSVC
jgi:hypothetical protein